LLNSLSLSSLLGSTGIADVAGRLGESESSTKKGLETTVFALLGGLLHKANEPGAMRQVIDLASSVPADTAKNVTSALDPANSTILSTGKRLVSLVFGPGESKVADAISSTAGLKPGTIGTLLAGGGSLLLATLGKRVRDEGLTATGLTGLLQNESSTIQRALPAGLTDIFRGVPAVGSERVTVERKSVDPVVAERVIKEKSSNPWLWLIPLALLLLGLLWYFMRGRSPNRVEETASTVQSQPVAAPNLGEFVKRQLPDNVELNVPANGVESRLLAFIQDPSKAPDTTSWFDFDRLLFDTGATTLRPESQEQLKNVAAILKAYPNVHIKVGGYTDSTGDAAANLKLSQGRADAVVAGLTALGIDASRLEAKGYGEQYPVGDNTTEEGRAKNRRVSMLVTQK
jgi:outer membrane protein OmpA-like peptidoglycan-associated protein